MASVYWPKKNTAYVTVIKLFPQNTTEWIAAPTLAAGDFKRVGYSSAGAVTLLIGNLTTLPSVVESASGDVVITLSSTEMNHDVVVVSWKDASGAEWQSGALIINTTADGADDVATINDTLSANVVQLSGDSTAADNAEAFFDGTGYAGTNNVIPTVTTVDGLAAGVITAAAIATDAIAAAKVAADAVTKIQNGLATPTNITAGTITTVTNLTNAPTNGDLTATMKTSVNAEVAAALVPVQADTNDIQARLPTALSADGYMQVDLQSIDGDLSAAHNLEEDYDGTGFARPLSTIGTVTNVTNPVTVAAGSITSIVSAFFANNLEAGKTFAQAVLDLWAKAVGNSAANDADAPTLVTYDSPDDTVQVTHTHTTTSRTKV